MNISQTAHVKTAARQYNVDFNWWPIDWLANYTKKKQRKTITDTSIAIRENIDLINNSCARQNIFFQQINELFSGLVNRLAAHMKKEEEDLFPVIREIIQAKELNRCINRVAWDKMECLIEQLNDEHDVESKRLKLSMQLRDNDQIYKGCSKEIKTLYTGLVEFEQDFELHIYLQSKLLFPKLMILNMR